MQETGSVLTVEAPAKVNLTLEVLGKRPDGYHALRSVLVPVTLSDTLRLADLPGEARVELEVTAEPGIDISQIGEAGDNLVVRTARLMMARYKHVSSGVSVRMRKRIPIGGGLGGGSADAAAAIKGLNRLWSLRLPLSELVEIGAELGSDVPALVQGGAVLMEGRGEFVTPLFSGVSSEECPGIWLVLVNPGVHCSTASVFKRWQAGLTPPPLFLHTIQSSIRTSDASGLAEMLFNGLQPGVFEDYPAVKAAAESLRAAGCLNVLLSGSGGSVFGIVRSREDGERVCRALPGGCWRELVRTCPVV